MRVDASRCTALGAGKAGLRAGEVHLATGVIRNGDLAGHQVEVAGVGDVDGWRRPGRHLAAAGDAAAIEEHVATSDLQVIKHHDPVRILQPPPQAIVTGDFAQVAQRHAAVAHTSDASAGQAAICIRTERQVAEVDVHIIRGTGQRRTVDHHATGPCSAGVGVIHGDWNEAKLIAGGTAAGAACNLGTVGADVHIAQCLHLRAGGQRRLVRYIGVYPRLGNWHRNQTTYIAFGHGVEHQCAFFQRRACTACGKEGALAGADLGTRTDADILPHVCIDARAGVTYCRQAPGIDDRIVVQVAVHIRANTYVVCGTDDGVVADGAVVREVGIHLGRHGRSTDQTTG